MTLETSAGHPAPVRRISQLLVQWIGRLGPVWVEGQVTQLVRRPGTRTAFVTLRDTAADVSLSVTVPTEVLDALGAPIRDGAQVIVHARPSFWAARGSLSMAADEIREVGIGALLARLDQLRRLLTAEGLFSAARKRPLPFLPHVVGLVCGRASAAERDVVENAKRRWPAVAFRVEEVAVQGPNAVTDVVAALGRLDADLTVDVIVIARGGGSVEDLLAFSNEALVRAVSQCRTPVVSAIGHEIDTPLVDLVADARASTPTDAAKLVVPDMAEEQLRIAALDSRMSQAMTTRLRREQASLDAIRSRPAMADPGRLVDVHEQALSDTLARARRCLTGRLDRADDDLTHARARVAALSPAATLARGYAVVQRSSDDAVVRGPGEISPGDAVRLRLAGGEVTATVATPRLAPTGEAPTGDAGKTTGRRSRPTQQKT